MGIDNSYPIHHCPYCGQEFYTFVSLEWEQCPYCGHELEPIIKKKNKLQENENDRNNKQNVL